MMSLRSFTGMFAAVLAAGIGFASPASAQASRTWVSGVGDDLNPCSRTAPCKTFAGAISKTAAGGEINCLDPGGFGAFTANKSITIDCTGTMGGVLAASTTGVLINTAAVHVILRGITINGGPPTLPGVHGIRFLQGASLTVQDVIIQNFVSTALNSGNGITVSVSNAGAELNVYDTTIVGNGTAAGGGGILINQSGGAGSLKAELRNVRVLNNGNNGLRIDTPGNAGIAGITVVIDDCLFSGNTNGINVNVPAATTTANVLVRNTVISNNSGTGIIASGSANSTIRVQSSVITLNGTGVSALGGANVQSFGNNSLLNNTSNGAFTGSVLLFS